jgi:hypothetical protein
MMESQHFSKNNGTFDPDDIISQLGQKSFSRHQDFLEKLIDPLGPEQLKGCFRAIVELLMQGYLHHMVRLDALALYHVLAEKAPESLWEEVSYMVVSKLDKPEEMYLASQLISPQMMPFLKVEDQEKIFRYLLQQLKKGEIEKGLVEGGEPAKCLVHLQDVIPDSIKLEIYNILCDGLMGSWWHEGFCVRFAIELASIFNDEQALVILKDIIVSIIEKNSFSARDELEFYIDKLPLSWYSLIIEVLKDVATDEQKQSQAIYWLDKIVKNTALDKELIDKANKTVSELLARNT